MLEMDQIYFSSFHKLKFYYLSCFMILGGLFFNTNGFTKEINDQIYNTSTFKKITRENLLIDLQAQKIIMLGEVHDNHFQHLIKANLIEELDSNHSVVSEHIPFQNKVTFTSDLNLSLRNAGFDKEAWSWPVHIELYERLRTLNKTIIGANLSRDLLISPKQKNQDILIKLSKIVSSCKLDEGERKKLKSTLFRSHCNLINEKAVTHMEKAQRLRDAAMAYVAVKNAPSILIAGNSHVRADYGVSQILNVFFSNISKVSVSFIEISENMIQDSEWEPTTEILLTSSTDYVWFTPEIEREDPCESLKYMSETN